MVFRSAKAEERKAQLAALQLVADQADQYLGVGNDVSADIAEGLRNYDWSGDASTLATDLEAAIRSARQTQSPSQMMVPIGQGISQGIGEGMGQYSLSGSALLLAANLSA